MSNAASEHIASDSLRLSPKCPRCGFLAPSDRDMRSLGEYGYCADCRCTVIARDNDDGDVPARIAELGVSCFDFEKEVACWMAFHGFTRDHAVRMAITVFEVIEADKPAVPASDDESVTLEQYKAAEAEAVRIDPEMRHNITADEVLAANPAFGLNMVPALTPPAEIATLYVHDEGDACGCTRSTVCRPCVVGHYARQGCTWHEGFDRTIASLNAVELAAWHSRIRRDIDDAQLAYDEEFPAVCDARLQAVIDHQTDRYLAGDDVADALAEMRALHNERIADDRRAHALLSIAI